MLRVLFIDTVHPILEKRLTEAGMICELGTSLSGEQVDEIIHLYDGLVIRSRLKLNKERLSKTSRLKFIARAGSGLENIDTEYCDMNKIKYYNAPEANCNAVAEHAIGMILNLFNRLFIGHQEVRNGVWKREENRGLELGHRTVGIIGYGHNGTAFGKLVKAFGATVLAYDKYAPVVEEERIQAASLQDIFEQADVLSFHVPLTEETTYYFNKDFLHKMSQPFYVINTSRGKVVNTNSLVKGLVTGKVLGACLDVLEYEKSSFEQLNELNMTQEMKHLLSADNVVLSPHVAGWTQESLVMLSEVLADKILGEFK